MATVVLLLSSCFGTDIVDLKISAAQTPDSTSKAIYSAIPYEIDESMLKDYVLGDPEFSITPSTFIMDIDEIVLFNPLDPKDIQKGAVSSFTLLAADKFDEEWILPKRYNMLSSKAIASLALPLSVLRKNWHGMTISFLPGGSGTTNGMWAGTLLGVRKDSLPPGITEEMIPNRMTYFPFGIEYPDDCIWFSYEDLFPFKIDGSLSRITFVDSTDTATFVNPDGEDGVWFFGGNVCHGNLSGIIIPMQTLKLSKMIVPELIIALDTENYIDFYSDGNGQYYAAISKTDPFPFRVYIDEYNPSVYLYSEQAVTDIHDAAPFDCFDYSLSTTTGFRHILMHTLPNYAGFSFVEIFRSQHAVFDESAVLIYAGTKLSIEDTVPAQDSEVYYYIRSVNILGQKSEVKKYKNIVTSFDY